MGTDLVAESVEARRLFELAEAITGKPISRLCAEGPLEQLTATDVAQPALVASSLAALAVLRSIVQLDFAAVAGHSVGEYAAYVAAGVLDAPTALKLVNTRAQHMARLCELVDGGMSAVIGLDEEPLRAACAAASENGVHVEIANLNAPGNLVVAGARRALERLGATAREAGARRVMPLNVSGPFHSRYMQPASEPIGTAAVRSEFKRGRVPVVLNVTAEPTHDPDVLRHELVVQVYSPVRWIETLQRLAALGCDRFLEMGPGNVLTGLARRTLGDVKVASFGSMADVSAAKALVAS
jgi:[acyl-carrier-protein] S-malonyltransferase